MAQRRYPPLLSGPSTASAVLGAVVVLAALLGVGTYSPFWLLANGHEGAAPAVVFYCVLLMLGVVMYRLVAPRIWTFTRLYSAQVQQQPKLPEHLLAACLKDTDYQCPVCCYNLRGLSQPACPECSTPVTLFLYAERPASARWNGLVFAWLALMLVASGLGTYSYTGNVLRMISYSSNAGWGYYYGGTTYMVLFVCAAIVALVSTLVCLALAAIAVIPKPPHRQSQFARRTAVWLSAAWTLSLALQIGVEIMRGMWY